MKPFQRKTLVSHEGPAAQVPGNTIYITIGIYPVSYTRATQQLRYVCMRVCMYICMYVYMHACIQKHTHQFMP